jgi:phytoene dehydrogenase-like protein
MSSGRDADVVVVGSGVGGLTTAAYLAAAGRHVVVLERAPKPGGNMAGFTHHGYSWDIGLDYVGAWRMARPGIRAFLEPLGIDIRFQELDPDGLEVLLFGDDRFTVPKGIDAFRFRLHEAFPRERGEIDRFLKRIVTIGEQLQAPPPSGAHEILAYGWRTRDAMMAAGRTLRNELDRLDCSPRLRTVLSWKHGAYGLPPSRAAFGMHALSCLHALVGMWHPEGGGQAVVDALVGVIGRHGGEIRVDTEVTRILVEHGQAVGVRLATRSDDSAADVEELRVPVVVAAGDLKRTVFELLDEESLPRRVCHRVASYEMGAAAFVISLVIDRDLRAEGMPKAAWWHAIDCDDIDAVYACLRHGQMPSQQWTGVTSPSLKDPTNPRLCRPGQTYLRVMTFAPASHEFWDVGPGLTAGAGYEKRRRQVRDRAVCHAERVIPGLADARPATARTPHPDQGPLPCWG